MKNDKEMILKENKCLSVALKSYKKEFESHVRNFDKEKNAFKASIAYTRWTTRKWWAM